MVSKRAAPTLPGRSFAALKVDFQGSLVTSDGGLILIRELDERRVWRNSSRNN